MENFIDEAKKNLEIAFWDLKNRQYFSSRNDWYWNFCGVSDPSSMLKGYQKEINDIISNIENKEKNCDNFLQCYCPDYMKLLDGLTPSYGDDEKVSKQKETATKLLAEAIKDIDDYIYRCSRHLANDFLEGIKNRITDIKTYGLGRPWGTEFRQRMAIAFNLKAEVNNLLDLGLNSIANSKKVNLGEHFIKLIQEDPEMQRLINQIENDIQNEIARNTVKIPNLFAIKMENQRISNSIGLQFGGKRADGDMIQQLEFTIRHPTQSYARYPETWNVAMNELTWSIRSANVRYTGEYQAVYNVYGYAFVWKVECSLEDTFDLRPASGAKIDFSGNGRNPAYNIVTSILGTLYHDILGNSDTMKVCGNWTMNGNGQDKIYHW